MRLRRRSTAPRARRQRQVSDAPSSPTSTLAYRPRRRLEEEPVPSSQPAAGKPKAERHFGRWILQRVGLIVLLIVILVSLVNVLTLSNTARVVLLGNATKGAGTFLHSSSDYQTAADQLLASSVWNRNKITLNTGSITQRMLKQFPELSSVDVSLPLAGKHPTIYLQTAGPALILTAHNGSFVIDTAGKALLLADNWPSADRQKLPVVTDQSNLTVSLNHQVMTSGDVSFIQTVVAQLAARHQTVSAADLPVGTRELDIHLSGQPYTVKFNLEGGDARQQAGTFLATQAKLQSQHITPAQYIDVRVDGRAYYQ